MSSMQTYSSNSRICRMSGPIAIIIVGFFMMLVPAKLHCEPLDWAFATVSGKAIFSSISGRMGWNQQIFGLGTLNDLRSDLGLPADNRTFEIDLTVRPLEHHLLRVFGRLPEFYSATNILPRTLVSRTNTYPIGTQINSDMRTAMFGFGYDLDLMIGPRWFGGLQGELRYIDLKLHMGNGISQQDDTIQVDEMLPCLGAHMATRFPFGLPFFMPGSRFGTTARMTYGITPNYLNYMDLKIGGTLLGGKINAPILLEAQAGYEHESFFHNQENASGRSVELKRDGVYVSLEVAY